tara:strand:+ start:55335 stop:56408 length:1074 start_codon:yes stop_codon:yes gene_type:complete
MKTHIQNIELINKYLHKRLLDNEVMLFENRIVSDAAFKKLYDEHLVFLEGLKRVALKKIINNAHTSYVINKRIKIAGISILILGLIVLAYIFFSNYESKINIKSNNENSSSFIILDSISTKTREVLVKSSDSVDISSISSIQKDSIHVYHSSTENKEKSINVFTKIGADNKENQEHESNEKRMENGVSNEMLIIEKGFKNGDNFTVDNELIFEPYNSFEFNGKEYQLENCDIAKESYGEISKWEIDFFCCNSKSYYSKLNKKEITTLLYFNFKTLKTDELTEGSYMFTKENNANRKSFTFTGEIRIENQILKITEGEFNVIFKDSIIDVNFNLKVNDNQKIVGRYSGNYNLILGENK